MYVMVFVTCPDTKTAEKISDALLKKRLAACTSIVPLIKSAYWWKGRIEKSDEALMVIKTRKALFRKLEEAVKKNHPCEVPEIVAVPIVAGSKDYLGWLGDSTG